MAIQYPSFGQVPKYDSSGAIIGYERTGTSTGTTRYNAGGGQAEMPVYTPQSGSVLVGSISGNPYTGTYNGVHYKQGKQLVLDNVTGEYMTSDEINQRNAKIQNDPAARYKAIDVIKSPDIASATSDLLGQYKKAADASLQDFGSYLNNFKSDVANARDLGKQATDVTEPIANLRNYQTQFNSGLDDANNRYSAALDSGAKSENALVQEGRDILPQYDEAAQAVADRQQQALHRQLSLYKMGAGAPTGVGSDEMKILARGVQDVQLPTQLAKIGRRYDLINNLALPVSRDITGRDINYAGSFLPSVANSRYNVNTGTEGAIQQLRMAVSSMSFDNATRYMQSLGVPWQVQDAILRGNISQLGGIAQLEDQSRYRGLQDTLGVNISQPAGASSGIPNLSYVTRAPSNGNGGGAANNGGDNGGGGIYEGSYFNKPPAPPEMKPITTHTYRTPVPAITGDTIAPGYFDRLPAMSDNAYA